MFRIASQSYGREVRVELLRISGLSDRDVQSAIEAWAMAQYGHRCNGIEDAIEWSMDDAEDEGRSPLFTAKAIMEQAL